MSPIRADVPQAERAAAVRPSSRLLCGQLGAGRILDAAQIERLLSAQLRAPSPASERIKVRGPLSSNSFSRVFRAEGGALPGPVAIKQFLRDQFGSSPADAARAYFDALGRLYTANEFQLGVTKPFMVFEEHGLVVASWIDGPSLPAWLLGASASDGRRMIHQAGVWLARLHRATGVEHRPLNIGNILGRLEEEIAEGAPPRRIIDQALRLLHAGASDAAGAVVERLVPWARSHGDFKPRNLIVCDGQLVGIDFDLLSTAPALHDVAHFLNHLQLLFYLPRTLLRRHEAAGLIAAFNQGYAEESGAPLHPFALSWERLRNAVHLLVRHKNWSRFSMRWPVKFALRHLVASLCDDLASQIPRPYKQ